MVAEQRGWELVLEVALEPVPVMAWEPVLVAAWEPVLAMEQELVPVMAQEQVPAHDPFLHEISAAWVSELRPEVEAERERLLVVPVTSPQPPAASVAEARPDTGAGA